MSNIPITRIDIFPHSGNKIPEAAVPFMRKDLTEQQIHDTIEVNRDSGLEKVIVDFQNNPEPGQAVITYDYARVLTDVNRLELATQMPETPYRGERLVDFTDELRLELAKTYIYPWHAELMELIKNNPDAVIIHWHSMDSHSGGITNVNADSDTQPTLRPAGQILSRVDTSKANLAAYFPDFAAEYLQSQLIEEKLMPQILAIFNEKLGKFAQTGTETKFVADRPYKLFGQDDKGNRIHAGVLTSLLSLINNNVVNKQLIFEIRKDLFTSDKIVANAREAVNESIKIMTGSK